MTDEELRAEIAKLREEIRRQRPLTVREMVEVLWRFFSWPWRTLVEGWRYASGIERGAMLFGGLLFVLLAALALFGR